MAEATAIKERLRDKLRERGLNETQLARLIGENQQTINQWLKTGKREPTWINKAANVLGLQANWLLYGEGAPHTPDPVGSFSGAADGPAPFGAEHMRKIPVYAAREAGLFLQITPTSIDWIIPPDTVWHEPDSFGVIVPSDTMAPALNRGDLAIVSRHRPPKLGRPNLLLAHDLTAPTRAMFREITAFSDDGWRVVQHNPPLEIDVFRKEWPLVFPIVSIRFA